MHTLKKTALSLLSLLLPLTVWAAAPSNDNFGSAIALTGDTRDRVLADMDAWGYTFRLGSARAYVDGDAEDAWAWLQAHGLISESRELLLTRRE